MSNLPEPFNEWLRCSAYMMWRQTDQPSYREWDWLSEREMKWWENKVLEGLKQAMLTLLEASPSPPERLEE